MNCSSGGLTRGVLKNRSGRIVSAASFQSFQCWVLSTQHGGEQMFHALAPLGPPPCLGGGLFLRLLHFQRGFVYDLVLTRRGIPRNL